MVEGHWDSGHQEVLQRDNVYSPATAEILGNLPDNPLGRFKLQRGSTRISPLKL